ncbi:MAG: ABC transporter permease [Rubrobacter sp.]|nr:ABC transporter permease [Rubrobacter sp.]
MRGVRLIAVREMTERLRDRGFILLTVFTLLLALGGGVLGALAGGVGPQEYEVAVVGEETGPLAALVEEQAPAFDAEVSFEPLSDAAAAERAVEGGEVDAAVVDGERILVDGLVEGNLEALLQSSAQDLAAAETLQEAGVPPGEVEASLEPDPLAVEDVGAPEASEPGASLVALGGLVLLFLTIYLYGYWIANGVVEEKSSRVVEIVLSTVRPWQLLAGKIIGIGLLGLGQLVLLGSLGLAAALVAGFELPPATFGAAGAILLWFILGFAFYSCLFAVAGSLVSKQEDVQYTQIPLMVLIFGGYGVSFSQLGDLGSVTAQALSFVPPFTPMLMLLRMGFGEAAAWEVALATLLMILATAGLVLLAARIYAGSVLRFGSRVSLGEVWRSLRQDRAKEAERREE